MIFFDIANINDISEDSLAFELKNSHNKSSKNSLAVRALLRKIIRKNLSIEDYTLSYDEKGKPMLDFCCLSLSHSGDFVACAVSDKPIGIDIEALKPIKKREKYHFLSKSEAEYVNSSNKDFSKRFLKVWTLKEARYKCENIEVGRLSEISVLQNDSEFDYFTEMNEEYIFSVCTKK